jgi:diacylglycerol kinase (ATP)
MDRIALVVNPRAGRGRVARELPRLLGDLRGIGIEPTLLETDRPGHGVELARRAAVAGHDTVVAVGGDGTVNEVVNGLIHGDTPVGPSALGVVAAGSGADFNRTWRLPKHTGDTLGGVLGPTRPLDVGKLTFQTPEGTASRYFVNIAEVGMGAETVRLAGRMPRWLGRSRYLIAFWPTLVRFRKRDLNVSTEDQTHTGDAHNAIIANGRYFGGGMHISPHSDPADGLLDLQVSVGPKRQAFTLIPRIYKGTHLPDHRIVEMSGRSGRIDSSEPMLVEADGEVLGTTPLGFEVIPGALPIRVGDASAA